MPALIYIHGFLSSPLSHKAQQVKRWLLQERPQITYHCPYLTPYPNEAKAVLESLVEGLSPQPVYLIGSSMGGFWATYLAEKYDLPAVLINPAVQPFLPMLDYIGVELKNFHTTDTYCLEKKHVEQLRDIDTADIIHKNNYWLLVQTGDETLHYHHAMDKYQGCKQLVEEGGNHAFEDFEKHIPEIVDFLESAADSKTV